MKKEQYIKTLFIRSGGVLTAQELEQAKISYYYIGKLLKAGSVDRIKQGLYRWNEETGDEWVEVKKMIPHGIFCLFSAALLHELTTFVPSEYHVAIPWKEKVTLTKFPPVKLYYWNACQHELGTSELEHDGYKLSVYDREKTVCDFVKFRNKVGLDTTKEVIQTYLRGTHRNLNKLMNYSRQLRISSVVQQHLEVML